MNEVVGVLGFEGGGLNEDGGGIEGWWKEGVEGGGEGWGMGCGGIEMMIVEMKEGVGGWMMMG